MQNKTLVAGIAAAIIILLGAGGIFLYSKNKTASTPNNTVASENSAPKEASGEGSWKDIFSNSGNKMCTIDSKDENGETKGSFYTSGEKAYGEIQITANSKTQKTFVIRNGDTFYMWGDSLPTGIKMTLSVDEMVDKVSGSESSGTAPTQNVKVNCSDWTVDSTKFNPPANIKFTDMSSVLKDVEDSSGDSSQCAICSSLTGDAKTACLTQFSCN